MHANSSGYYGKLKIGTRSAQVSATVGFVWKKSQAACSISGTSTVLKFDLRIRMPGISSLQTKYLTNQFFMETLTSDSGFLPFKRYISRHFCSSFKMADFDIFGVSYNLSNGQRMSMLAQLSSVFSL